MYPQKTISPLIFDLTATCKAIGSKHDVELLITLFIEAVIDIDNTLKKSLLSNNYHQIHKTCLRGKGIGDYFIAPKLTGSFDAIHHLVLTERKNDIALWRAYQQFAASASELSESWAIWHTANPNGLGHWCRCEHPQPHL